jgi:putative transposase
MSIAKQCKLLSINRSTYYYQETRESEDNLSLMRVIDEEFLKYPFYGSRQMRRHLTRKGCSVSRHRIRRLMQKMSLVAVYQKPKTSSKNKSHKIYPYLLRNLNIAYSNQVWCSDITYIPINRGFLYLTAIKDWFSRKVLAWRLSNSLDASFCVAALEEAIYKYGTPEIFNTDQGSQYTSTEFTDVLQNHHIRISMDGKGRWIDNVFIERLWRSLKYECIYMHDLDTGIDAKLAIDNWIEFYNNVRPHSAFNGMTPTEVYDVHLRCDHNQVLAG